MPNYLLTGAGFSANWGGWTASEAFEYLLGCPEIIKDSRLSALLWRHQDGGGFEAALAELRLSGTSSFSKLQFEALQNAIARMFDDMNSGFRSLTNFEFNPENRSLSVRDFPARFDAIFTLNQDVLLETFYFGNLVQKNVPQIPGMRRKPHPEPLYAGAGWSTYEEMPEEDFKIHPSTQPYIKLHGSANWFGGSGGRLLILGTAKQNDIQQTAILRWYSEYFEKALLRPDSRLMIIGYGFRDEHINQAIEKASQSGLKLFVIDPRGARLAYAMNETRRSGLIQSDSELEVWLQPALIGGSSRPLQKTFGSDIMEHTKVCRFFIRN